MKIYLVGIGPGGRSDMTVRATETLAACDVIAGYTGYIDLVRADYPDKEFLSTAMRGEEARCRMALAEAAAGKSVAMVCSGDSGVYGMAGLVYELAGEYPPIEIEVVPGVTAACSGAALLGAPLIHDFAVISLSDLLTPWGKIVRRLHAVAAADFCISLYNPASKKRADYLQKACDILLEYRDPNTLAGIVRNIGRADESAQVVCLQELRDIQVDMFTTVFIGNSETKRIGEKMVTPRGYHTERVDTIPKVEAKTSTAPLFFPQFISLVGKRVVLFGGGAVAGRRAAALLPFGVQLTVIAPVFGRELQEMNVSREARPYQAGDCAGFELVLAATDNRVVNRTIYEEAKKAGISVNVADAPAECDFYFPALAHRDNLVVGVNASGTDHKMTARVAQEIRVLLDRKEGDHA